MRKVMFQFIPVTLLTTATLMAGIGTFPMAWANPTILKSIVAYNHTAQLDSLADGSYKGEAGILNIDPEAARSMGMKALITQEYVSAKDQDARAERLFSQALSALSVEEDEKEEQAGRAGESAVASNEARDSAKRLFAAYRSKVTPEVDERLNNDLCFKIMDRLLDDCIKRASFNLRDALGMFYNRCQGLPDSTPPLTPENVTFVNHVFSEFSERGSGEDKRIFDLGRQGPAREGTPGTSWKAAVDGKGAQVADMVASFLENNPLSEYPVDPLLFIALMKRESDFDPRAVSYLGAAGLTQIMPQTGKDLGMKQVYQPPYFEEAMALFRRERELKQKTVSILLNTTRDNVAGQTRLARDTMRDSLDCGRKRSHLFGRYRRELLKNGQDDRLDPHKAIACGYRYFSDLMRMQRGDISLALASYNAGPHRVKQYNGLPPYEETVTFRNTVLKYYREYLSRLK